MFGLPFYILHGLKEPVLSKGLGVVSFSILHKLKKQNLVTKSKNRPVRIILIPCNQNISPRLLHLFLLHI
ncbi:hypothetical protein L1987_56517 [Smallanthus sonchifolius]|uniref:Uncharacterized protein n=1 Tax=Smallanthus sonchifolius TaxID=185202 RepID=A0ACB9EDF1_9ASTR|nr:hypothetical protein L1987_56517 [Smallanthus sonchifolius]